MRPLQLNRYERVAGLFILFAIGGALVSALSVAIKQGWFEPRIRYQTTFEDADGVHAGTSVKMAGLQAGSVEGVELLADNRVRVNFYVLGKFRERIRQDSKAMLIRPFIIGDRVLEISVGNESLPAVAEHEHVTSEEAMDLMAFMSGKRMNDAMGRLGLVLDNLQTVMEAFSNKERVQSAIRMFDRMEPMLERVTAMSSEVTKLSRQATKDDNLAKLLAQVNVLSRELNQILPALNEQNPELGKDMAGMMKSLSRLTGEMDRSFAEVGQEMPGTVRRAVEALNEATVLIKAMQKSMFVRGSVREVHEEEAKEKQRLPAAKEATVP
ncbi:MAG: MCE family protein [Bdellovibrionaceae bacterium]|nr:MCE family protein [Pseudobdellovibrionaceae bacterium]